LPQIEFELIALKTGQMSLRSLVHRETFHPVVGPQAEANLLHVEQHHFVKRCAEIPLFVLWDVGLGAAANVLAAIEAIQHFSSSIEIHSFDKSTSSLEFALQNASSLPYLMPHRELLAKLLVTDTHEVTISPTIRWRLHRGDFREIVKDQKIPAPHAIIYDPYSPGTNPEMWTLDHFKAVRARLIAERPCLLSNYTRSTAVRVTLLLAGFYVGVGSAVGEKEETTLFSNDACLIQRPLDRLWLDRVSKSTNAAPLRLLNQEPGPIHALDFEYLLKCPQFITVT
jgi:tRNA U34 5-methylaminomethyl-2-thiouridine-forming methyltransferase MnmC